MHTDKLGNALHCAGSVVPCFLGASGAQDLVSRWAFKLWIHPTLKSPQRAVVLVVMGSNGLPFGQLYVSWKAESTGNPM